MPEAETSEEASFKLYIYNQDAKDRDAILQKGLDFVTVRLEYERSQCVPNQKRLDELNEALVFLQIG